MHIILKKIAFSLITFPLFFSANSQTFKNINIEIAQDSIDELESHPFTNEDVYGNFIIDGQRFDTVELHYRGAYYLLSLINQGSLRNWKVKFSKEEKLEDRREWNFNYENYIRQNLAYHIFRQAGVPVVSSENVILSVNGQRQGLYLKYEDPDNKDWLKEAFGDNDGDLYKAAYDMPNEVKYFADLTYLGPNDSDYFLHYRKQTNKKGANEFDYSSIREFTEFINQTTDEEFEEEILQHFDVAEFIEYLVVSNFISNWDSYPYRPKNFFLYQNPDDDKWHFIPWDLDGTFQATGNRNPIGITGSIFHYFDGIAPYNHTPTEPLARPLVWRIMDIQQFRDKYCYEYHKALNTYLDPTYLHGIADSIALGVANNTFGQELNTFNNDVSAVKSFITQRKANVSTQLAGCVVNNDPLSIDSDKFHISRANIYPNPATKNTTIEFPKDVFGEIKIQLVNVLGQTSTFVNFKRISNSKLILNTEQIMPGQYFVAIKTKGETFTGKLSVGHH